MKRLLFALALTLSCDPETTPRAGDQRDAGAALALPAAFSEAERAKAIAAGKATITKHECTRCHVIDDIAPGPRPLHCTSCHEFLKGLTPKDHQYQEIASKYGEPIIQRYQRNIWHLRRVPNLTLVGKRLKPAWIAQFLAEPFDVRPVMTESMIRHRLSSDEIAIVARYFAAVAGAPDPSASRGAEIREERPSEARIHAGGALLLDRGCGRCHAFGNVALGATRKDLEASYDTALLAPNLRFTRERMQRATVERWIVSPQSVVPHAAMPAQMATPEEASKIVDYLFWADPELAPPPDLVAPKVRPVDWHPTWEDVKERVLGRICVHCHMNDYEKDKGPGNRGGFGYAGIHLAMRTYETLVFGAEDARGRYSVLVPKDGEPYAPIVMAMLRRRVEAARDQVPAFEDHERPSYPKDALAGMPLGLPAMSDEEIGVVERWIEDGCPGPTKVTGMAGIYDGFLVPDGPITKNKGCELREPSKVRPEWAKLTEKNGLAAEAPK